MNLINISKLDLSVKERNDHELIKKLDKSIILYMNFNDYLKTLKELLKTLSFICSDNVEFTAVKKYLFQVDTFINQSIECKNLIHEQLKKRLDLEQLLILFEIDIKGVKL